MGNFYWEIKAAGKIDQLNFGLGKKEQWQKEECQRE
jgi:hypothetical protein